MKEKLQQLLEENRGNIREAVITEAQQNEDPYKFLLYVQENWTEWWIVECLEFEKDTTKFFNKYYAEIEGIRDHLQQYWNPVKVPQWYTMKHHYANMAFKFIAFEIYMQLTIEEL